VSLRQAVVPDHLMGRVVSAFRTLAHGAVVLAATGLLALPVVNAGTVRAARIAAGPARPDNDVPIGDEPYDHAAYPC
jgi:hypothetical protein